MHTSLENELIQRTKFKIEITKKNKDALKTTENTKELQKHVVDSRIDHHVFIRFPNKEQHF
ncbi:MAG: hypothetical protein HOF75_04715 [Flavobacteriaceae bacterium]|nr:hypothetical protein [Flavobacteriaceae bacterium]MBT3919298.1 hypothetical protein [Flavobacteriaceae bacterium]MBT6705445.1 hypothetical protein [Flavobacteriaceae bacterium]